MRSMLFLFITTVQIFCICFADYSFYWVLAMITYYGSQTANIEGELPTVNSGMLLTWHFLFHSTVDPYIAVDVEGDGYVSDMLRGIVDAFEPFSQKYSIDATPCLPRPRRPNFRRYLEIGGCCLLAWIFLFCEPYGLRLRHIVMRLYYPAEARQRAAWLYNEILMKRSECG